MPPLLDYEDDLFLESNDEESVDKITDAKSASHLFESAHSMNFIEKDQEKDVIAIDENDNTSVSSNLHINDADEDGVVIQRTTADEKDEEKEDDKQEFFATATPSASLQVVEDNNNSLQSPWKVISDKFPKEQLQINSISFNHEKNCISIGTSLGFIVRTVHPKKVGSIDRRERIQQF